MSSNLPSEPQELVSLPPPSRSDLSSAPTPALSRAATHYLNRWQTLSSELDDLKQRCCVYVCPKCGQSTEFRGEKLWHRLNLVTGAYYEFTTRKLLLQSLDRKGTLPPGLKLEPIKQLVEEAKQREADQLAFDAIALLTEYRLALLSAYFIAPIRRLATPNVPIKVFEVGAHEALVNLNARRAAARNLDQRRLLTILSDGLAEVLKSIYAQSSPTWNQEHRAGPFSSIRLGELALLARREQNILSQYGAKHVESIFEQQLALILQSLGFVVIRTRRGDRTVDLVCISSDSEQNMTILVEAKTTSQPYALPTDDQRALVQYAQDVRQNLTTLPHLAFVLIVVPSASKSIETRLADLESRAGVPVRMMSASDLAQIRESVPGPLRIGQLRDVLLSSQQRFVSNVSKALLETHTNIQVAHEALVRACLPGVRRDVAQAQWDHEH